MRTRAYAALLSEVRSFASRLAPNLETVFLGGGTPSLAPLEVMGALFNQLSVPPESEVTIEANPSSITLEKAKAWKQLGVNRVSIGVQALNDSRLKWLGRAHDVWGVYEALTQLFEAGFRRVSIDYIVGVPGQTTTDIENELGGTLKRFPHIQHVSAYLLTLKQSNSKFSQLPRDDEQLKHLRSVSGVLADQGFEQYEISNFSRPGQRALHNENYWLGGGYLGVGPSAHSYWPELKRRTKNWASLGKYADLIELQRAPVEWEETLSEEQERLEYLMLRLRRADGIDLTSYKSRFGRDLVRENEARINLWISKGLCRLGARLQLTSDGFFLSDQILSNIN